MRSVALRWLVLAVLAAVICVPIALAMASPLLAWRSLIYITACFAGIIALVLLLLQPLLIGGYLSGLGTQLSRRVHHRIGAVLVLAVMVHVGGLWITSPPDVIDALLFSSPTPFSNWGVIAMWALFATALVAMLRKRLRLGPRSWKLIHMALVVVIVTGTVVHAILIEGAMETISKVVLCGLVVVVSLKVMTGQKFWSELRVWAKRTLSRS